MTGTNCDLFTHKQSRSYFNHLVYVRLYPGVNVTPFFQFFSICELMFNCCIYFTNFISEISDISELGQMNFCDVECM
jgi:hypothetical protein